MTGDATGSGHAALGRSEHNFKFVLTGQVGVAGKNAPDHFTGTVFDPSLLCTADNISRLRQLNPSLVLSGEETPEELFPEILNALPVDELPSGIVLIDRGFGNEIDRVASSDKVKALLTQGGILSHGMIAFREKSTYLDSFVGIGSVATSAMLFGDHVSVQIENTGSASIEVSRLR